VVCPREIFGLDFPKRTHLTGKVVVTQTACGGEGEAWLAHSPSGGAWAFRLRATSSGLATALGREIQKLKIKVCHLVVGLGRCFGTQPSQTPNL